MWNALVSRLLLKLGPESTQRLSLKGFTGAGSQEMHFHFLPRTSPGSDTIITLSKQMLALTFILYFCGHFTHKKLLLPLFFTQWEQAKLNIAGQKASISPQLPHFTFPPQSYLKTIKRIINAPWTFSVMSRFSDSKKEKIRVFTQQERMNWCKM